MRCWAGAGVVFFLLIYDFFQVTGLVLHVYSVVLSLSVHKHYIFNEKHIFIYVYLYVCLRVHGVNTIPLILA